MGTRDVRLIAVAKRMEPTILDVIERMAQHATDCSFGGAVSAEEVRAVAVWVASIKPLFEREGRR